MRTVGASRKVMSWVTNPPELRRVGKPGYCDHELTLDCGHTVRRRAPLEAKFKFAECPVAECVQSGKVRQLRTPTIRDRYLWLTEKLLTDPVHFYSMLRMLGFKEDEFDAPGDVTPGMCFDAAIDKRITKGL